MVLPQFLSMNIKLNMFMFECTVDTDMEITMVVVKTYTKFKNTTVTTTMGIITVLNMENSAM
jgi:hypothetical protein